MKRIDEEFIRFRELETEFCFRRLLRKRRF